MRTVRVEDVSHLSGASALVFPMGIREQVDSGYFSYIDAVRDRGSSPWTSHAGSS